MCGIWAGFGFGECISKHLNCFLSISHRGPDASRLENLPQFPNCWLGFHHLSIVDDFNSMQPMRIRSFPHLYLLYNGEIYNHKSLGQIHNLEFTSRTDGEVMLHLYEKFGVQSLSEQLDGVFAFVIIDTRRKQVHLGRDPYGVRPLFTLQSTKSGILGISSEAKGLLPLKQEENGLKFDLTPFKPGHFASYTLKSDGSVQLLEMVRYTWVGKAPVFALDIELDPLTDIKENIRKSLAEAVRKRLMSDRRIGCLLSGGLDSSLVAALLVKLAKEAGIEYPVQTFTIGMPGSTDMEYARKVATHLGTEHYEVLCSQGDIIKAIDSTIFSMEMYDVITIRGAICMGLVSRYISQNTDSVVIYSGEGADELTQGYLYFHSQPDAEEGDLEGRRLLEDIYLYDGLRADRMTAAHGLELRLPFLDITFSSYYLSIDAELRRPTNGIEKFLLRSAFDGENLIPEDVLWRQKEGFSDGVCPLLKGKSLFEIFNMFFEQKISNEELDNAVKKHLVNTPTTKEALYYRDVFEDMFPGQSQLTPYFWMPKWVNAKDPSNRILQNYRK